MSEKIKFTTWNNTGIFRHVVNDRVCITWPHCPENKFQVITPDDIHEVDYSGLSRFVPPESLYNTFNGFLFNHFIDIGIIQIVKTP